MGGGVVGTTVSPSAMVGVLAACGNVGKEKD
jgi:hypothetical protein